MWRRKKLPNEETSPADKLYLPSHSFQANLVLILSILIFWTIAEENTLTQVMNIKYASKVPITQRDVCILKGNDYPNNVASEFGKMMFLP